MEDRSGIDKLS